MKYFVLIISILSFNNFLFGQKLIEIDEKYRSKFLHKSEIFYLEDASNKLTLEQVLSENIQKKFKHAEKNNLNFGFSTNTFWIKVKVKNTTSYSNNHYLELAYPHTDFVTFFQKGKSGKWIKLATGDYHPFSQRKIKHRNFIFDIFCPKNQSRTYYLKIKSSGSLIIPLKIHSTHSLHIEKQSTDGFLLFFFGVLSIMIAYNFFLYLSVKDRNYLYYSLMLTSALISQSNHTGFLRYFWGDNIWWSNYSLPFLITIAIIVQTWFGINYLGLKKYSPKTYKGFMIFMGVNVVNAILCLGIIDYTSSNKITALMMILFAISIFIISLISWMKGKKSARFFVLAWFVYVIAIITIALRNLGFLPDIFIIRYGLQIGTMLETLFLSFSLADKISFYRKKTETAQKLALQKTEENAKIIKEQNETLEIKVQERTKELHEKQQEILTQNEELMQQSEEILTQRDYIAESNKQILENLKTLEDTHKSLEEKENHVRNSIRAAQTIQSAILPYKEKMDDLLKDYFIIYKPRDVVSGDFYWLNEVANKKILVTIDCTGHGVPGAFMSLIANTLLDKIIRVWDILDPTKIFNRLHTDIQIMLRQDITKNNMGMDANIIIWQELDEKSYAVLFAGAKLDMLYYSPDEKKILKVKGTRKSIGGQQNEKKKFKHQVLILPRNTTIYTGSDGLPDQNDVNRKKITERRIVELLEQNIDKGFDDQKQLINNLLDNYLENTSQRDDILWIGFKLV